MFFASGWKESFPSVWDSRCQLQRRVRQEREGKVNWSQREEAIYVWREEATKVVRHASRRGSHRRGMRTGIRDGVCGQYVEMLKCVCTSVTVTVHSVLHSWMERSILEFWLITLVFYKVVFVCLYLSSSQCFVYIMQSLHHIGVVLS